MREEYKYNSDEDVWNELVSKITDAFSLGVILESYNKNKAIFCLQALNLSLSVVFVYFALNPILESWSRGAEESSVLMIKVLAIFFLYILFTFIGKVVKWQFFFEMNLDLSVKWFLRLVVLNSLAYLAKIFGIYGKAK